MNMIVANGLQMKCHWWIQYITSGGMPGLVTIENKLYHPINPDSQNEQTQALGKSLKTGCCWVSFRYRWALNIYKGVICNPGHVICKHYST
jgi:hypothetical protein